MNSNIFLRNNEKNSNNHQSALAAHEDARLVFDNVGFSKKSSSSGLTVGIDLGTTTSLVAFSQSVETHLIATDCGQNKTPSVVNYFENQIIVGREAIYRADTSRSVFSVKRFLGSNERFFGRTAVEVSADILFYLKKSAEQSLGQKIDAAVITVPAHFSDLQRMETKQAASIAGIKVLRLINEPAAAAIAFGLDKEKQGLFGVYDFGGGTFDFSLLRLSDGIFQVLATGGDNYLGGDDLDNEIFKFNLQLHSINIAELTDFDRILGKLLAKSMKESIGTNHEINKNYVCKNKNYSFELSQGNLENLSEKYIKRTLRIADQVFSDAKISREKVNGIVLIGGMTKLSLVKSAVKKHFGINVLDEINPEEAVARGAAIHAESISKKSSDMILIDVVPLTLGIETFGGGVDKIIHRNTPIPTIQKREYTTQVDNQTGMKFHIVQGERPLAKDCRSMANFELTGIPSMPFGKPRVEVEFSVDVNGLLSVKAHEKSTGITQSVTVESSGGLSENEIAVILENAMKNRKQYLLEESFIAEKVESEHMIRFWELIIDELPNDTKKSALKSISDLKNALNTKNCEHTSSIRKRIDDIFSPFLDQIISNRLCGKKIVACSEDSTLYEKHQSMPDTIPSNTASDFQIKMIAIVDSEFGISKNGKIPWGFEEDLKFFIEKTKNSVVVMGKNTYFSLPNSPLKNRVNYVISKKLKLINGAEIFPSLEEAITRAKNDPKLCNLDFWIIGGADLFNYALKNSLIDQALITCVHKNFDADLFIDKTLLDSMIKKIIFENQEYSIYKYSRSL